MIYTFNIPLLIRRFVPLWFRHAPNLAFAYVLCSWMARIHLDFLAWRTNAILAEYRYNGLIHSLERMLNDRFDPVDRRIYITVVNQLPVYYHVGDGAPAVVSYLSEGMLSGYYHLDDGAIPSVYTHEFTVHVDTTITFSADEMFRLLDLYRYAGRRPAIQTYNSGGDVDLTIYPDNAVILNYP